MRALRLRDLQGIGPESVKPGAGNWVDVAHAEFAFLEKWGVSAREYASDCKRNYPRYIERKSHTALVLFSISSQSGALVKRRMVFYIMKNSLVSVGASEMMGWFVSEMRQERKSRDMRIELAILEIFSEMVKRQAMLLLHYEEAVNRLENVAADEKQTLNLRDVFILKRQLIAVSKILWREREIVFDMRNSHVQFLSPNKQEQTRLEDAFGALLFDMNTVDNQREVLSDVVDIHHTIVSNSINKSIERLTFVTVWLAIVGTISAFPNTIATIFGVPFLPMKADVAVFEFGGMQIYPWELLVFLLVAFTVIPAIALIAWWKKSIGLKK